MSIITRAKRHTPTALGPSGPINPPRRPVIERSPLVPPASPRDLTALEWATMQRGSGPIIPTSPHPFRPYPTRLRDQCGYCWGWYDDPRHI